MPKKFTIHIINARGGGYGYLIQQDNKGVYFIIQKYGYKSIKSAKRAAVTVLKKLYTITPEFKIFNLIDGEESNG